MAKSAGNKIDDRILKDKFSLKNVRNMGIIAHIDAGKTTTTERILYYTGVNYKIGEVHEGTATMDWMVQEQERGITITSATTTCVWNNYKVNLIDTPGHVDFTAEVERSLRVLDGTVAVFCSVGGVQSQTETVWKQAKKYKVPIIAFVNKMDRIGANFEKVVLEINKKLNSITLPIQIPIGAESDFVGIIDVIKMKAIYFDEKRHGTFIEEKEIPSNLEKVTTESRNRMLECLADFDEEIADIYLQDKIPDIKSIKKSLRKLVLQSKVIPIMCGAAFKNKGIQPLLDAVIDYLPSPEDVNEIVGMDPRSEKEKIISVNDDNQSTVALIFKIVNDPFVGKLTFFRVYRGSIKSGAVVYNPRTRKNERLGRILQIHANIREEKEIVFGGDIAAAVGLRDFSTGDTMCAINDQIVLESIHFPEPVISVAVEPKTSIERDKLSKALIAISVEDPTFIVNSNQDTGQTIISGMGELHLEIILDRIAREFKVDINSGKPKVSYKETILNSASSEAKFIKQTGGRGQYGHVIIDITPKDRGYGITVESKVRGGNIPKEYLKPIENGIRESAQTGVLIGYPLTDFHINILDGSYHPVDSSELAFKIAGSMALRQVAKEAIIKLLEPVMKLEVSVPEEYMGDIIGDISSRRGSIISVDTSNNDVMIIANVPLSEMFGYSTIIRSITKGRALHSMEPSHYSILPEHLQKSIMENKS